MALARGRGRVRAAAPPRGIGTTGSWYWSDSDDDDEKRGEGQKVILPSPAPRPRRLQSFSWSEDEEEHTDEVAGAVSEPHYLKLEAKPIQVTATATSVSVSEMSGWTGWTEDEDGNEDKDGDGQKDKDRPVQLATDEDENGEKVVTLDTWNPLESHAKLNPPFDEHGDLDMVHLLTGAPLREDLFCQFSIVAGTGMCWKGNRCRRPHRDPDRQRVVGVSGLLAADDDYEDVVPKNDSGKMESRPRQYDGLPRQRRCPPGIMFKAKVVHVVDPEEFYVIPCTELKCLCKHYDNDKDKFSSKEFPEEFAKSRVGLRSHARMLEAMKETLNALPAAAASTKYYPISEVVACRHHHRIGRACAWERAVITKPSSFDFDVNPNAFSTPAFSFGFKPATASVGVTLLDTGEKLTTKATDLAVLPAEFLDYAPFAYKCRLHGILPIVPGFWSAKTKERFQAMVDQKEVFVEVRRSVFANAEEARKGVHSERPYGVSLRTHIGGGVNVDATGIKNEPAIEQQKYVCVEHELCKTYEALAADPRAMEYEYTQMMNQEFMRMENATKKAEAQGRPRP